MAAATSWQPQAEQLNQLVQYLNDSLAGRDPNTQKRAETMLKQAKSSPDIDNYLCFLLADRTTLTAVNAPSDVIHTARSAAGIMLKNNIKANYKSIQPSHQSYIKSTILLGLQDDNAQIRSYAGNVITELVRQAGVMGWPEILEELVSTIQNSKGQTTPHAQEGAMSALLKVCEDNKKALSKSYNSQCPLDILVPKFLEFTSHQLAKVRANAIGALNVFLPDKPNSLMQNLNTLLNQLFNLTNDSSDEVRKNICRAIVHIAEIAPLRISPHMGGLVDYILVQQRNVDDTELALDAAEFWLAVGEDDDLRKALAPYLSKVVPVLLECMVYSEDDVLRLEGEAEDAEQEDRDQDIKPNFATVKNARMTTGSNGYANGEASIPDSSNPADDGDLSEGELEEYDEDDNEDDPEGAWNLRKCSAAALDVLASVFHQPVFQATLPYLEANLKHSEWPNREAAVLAIGAIAEGCMEDVEPHLPDLIPFLINLLQDSEPVVRQITCWSLGRYSAWASHLDEDGRQRFFVPMMDGILKRMLDSNKRVQEAAASAFANLEEKANRVLENPAYCEVIARQFAECFAKYKDRNMFILYDCVQTLAEHVGPTLQNPELVHSLMPAILKRWEKVPDASREMFPLQECLSYVATALGNTFSPYAEPIFQRCINIIYTNLQDSLNAQHVSSAQGTPLDAASIADSPEKDFLVTSLDLLSAIIQALPEDKNTALVSGMQPRLFDLLLFCLEDPSNDVRQSAYALLGDCAIYVFSQLQPALPQILPVLLTQLAILAPADTTNGGSNTTGADSNPASNATGSQRPKGTLSDSDFAVTNNACWSVGEIAMRAGTSLSPYTDTLLQHMFTILTSTKPPLSLHENAAIALGRFGTACADQLTPHLGSLAPLFLNVMKRVEWTDEKADAVAGMAQVVVRNPRGLGSEMAVMEWIGCVALGAGILARGRSEVVGKTLQTYKEIMPNFAQMVQHLPPELQQNLKQVFSV